MKRHTVYGESILGKSETPILKLGGVIALNHHEAWDGSGYPYGIKGESIPLAARIVAVADVFDALTSKRSYKEAWAMDAAISELQSLSGQRLDPRCVTAFMNCLTAVKDVMANFDNQ
jgi:HD-GYP domain-containing protein (c-di-GMP phosphodiesterase class II)